LGVYSYKFSIVARASNSGNELSVGFNLNSIIDDEYGYVQSGWSAAASLSSAGLFGLNLTLADSRFGFPTVLSTSLAQNRFTTRLSSQYSTALNWFYSDGLIGIARLSLVPFLEFQYARASNVVFGTQILLDGVFSYYAPVSFGLEVSYSSGNGFAIGLVTLIPLLQGLR
jgi:hypothetical protein